jgi:hypothetical protein
MIVAKCIFRSYSPGKPLLKKLQMLGLDITFKHALLYPFPEAFEYPAHLVAYSVVRNIIAHHREHKSPH